MAMGSSGPRGLSSDINVTPLIDVLLVLLIIFMVIVPVSPKGLEALIPQSPRKADPVVPPSTIVVQVIDRSGDLGPSYKINEDPISGKPELLSRLTGIFATRADRVMFVKGTDNLNFASIAEVIDIGHSAGVDHIGLITPKDGGVQ